MNNKKNKFLMVLSVGAILLVSTKSAEAQKGEFGLRFMPTFSSFNMKTSAGNTVTGEASLGYGFGAFGAFNFNDHIGIQAEVIYTSISQKYTEVNTERDINLRYFNIPLLISLNTGKSKPVNFNVVAGPQLGISAGSEIHVSAGGAGTETTHAVLAVKTGDIGFAYGAGVDFGLNPSQTFRLGVGFRGVYGLFDISDDSGSLTDDSFFVLEKTHVKTYSGYLGFSLLF